MPRPWRQVSLAVVTALLIIVTSLPLRAIGPAILMFYGGDLREPVLVFPGNPARGEVMSPPAPSLPLLL